MPGETKLIPILTLGKKVLCVRHNRSLSKLDAKAREFAQAYADLMIHLQGGAPGDYHRFFNGLDIERWMLKVLCGLQAGEHVPGTLSLKHWTVPPSWLEILFGSARFPPRTGLYCPKEVARHPGAEAGIVIERTFETKRPLAPKSVPLLGATVKSLVGLRVTIFGFQFQLRMVPPQPSERLVYRARMRRFPDPMTGRSTYIHLGWDEHPPTFAGKVAFREEQGFTERTARMAADRKARRGRSGRKRR